MSTTKMDIYFGTIDAAIEKALAAATPDNAMEFDFNGVLVTVKHGDDPEAIRQKWSADMDANHKAWLESPEYAEQQRKQQEHDAHMQSRHLVESAKDEAAMRESDVPTAWTSHQLSEYIESLVEREHDYGSAVYAMSMAAVAAFNYVAHREGVTGFQASCADLDIVRRRRRIKGPFMFINLEDALYPQYDLHEKVDEMLTKNADWLKKEAARKLAESSGAHPNVVAHWKRLAGSK